MTKAIAYQLWLRDLSHSLAKRLRISELKNERGDVPGWVLVVLMTAGLVTGIWALAGPRLSAMLTTSLDAVSAPR